MQFGLRHLLIFVTIVSFGLALGSLGETGISLCIPYCLFVLAIWLLYLHGTSAVCPEYLKLRYHAPVILISFVVTHWWMPYFFKYGIWEPPISWFVTFVSVPLISALQIAKWHDIKQPHHGARIAQVSILWGLLMMRVLVLIKGNYTGP